MKIQEPEYRLCIEPLSIVNLYYSPSLYLPVSLSINQVTGTNITPIIYIYIYIYTFTHAHTHAHINILIYEVHTINFRTNFVWALLLTVHTRNSRSLRSSLLRLQCTCITPTISGRPHGCPLVWACQWPSSQPLLSLQLSYNDTLWA